MKGDSGVRHIAVLFPALAVSALLAVRGAVPVWAADPPGYGLSPSNMTAEIRGEVARPGIYPVRKGDTLSSLILQAGGFTDNAFLPGAVLLRSSENARQAVELAGFARRLEAAIRQTGPGNADTPRIRRFLDALRNLDPSGRIPVRLSHPRLMINAPDDLPLENGDTLYLPPEPRTLRIAGAVRNPGVYPYSPGTRFTGLTASSGGLLPEADRDGTMLLKADGTAQRLSEEWIVWNGDAGRWELSFFRKNRPRIEAGDTVFVPRDPVGIAWPGGIEDYRRTMMRILEITGAGAAW